MFFCHSPCMYKIKSKMRFYWFSYKYKCGAWTEFKCPWMSYRVPEIDTGVSYYTAKSCQEILRPFQSHRKPIRATYLQVYRDFGDFLMISNSWKLIVMNSHWHQYAVYWVILVTISAMAPRNNSKWHLNALMCLARDQIVKYSNIFCLFWETSKYPKTDCLKFII